MPLLEKVASFLISYTPDPAGVAVNSIVPRDYALTVPVAVAIGLATAGASLIVARRVMERDPVSPSRPPRLHRSSRTQDRDVLALLGFALAVGAFAVGTAFLIDRGIIASTSDVPRVQVANLDPSQVQRDLLSRYNVSVDLPHIGMMQELAGQDAVTLCANSESPCTLSDGHLQVPATDVTGTPAVCRVDATVTAPTLIRLTC